MVHSKQNADHYEIPKDLSRFGLHCWRYFGLAEISHTACHRRRVADIHYTVEVVLCPFQGCNVLLLSHKELLFFHLIDARWLFSMLLRERIVKRND